ncbi:MAG: T9SS type A sorting domain-containing protein [Saprospiraceae bacterium]|nr:T9SS type A sorting domain-containing protein [Saprospiraceae bacterium]
MQLFKTFNNPGSFDDYENAYSDLMRTSDGNLLTAGGLYDTTSNAQIRVFNTEGDTVLTKSFRSILYPEHSYLVVLGIQRRLNGDYGVLISFETNENPHDADISLLVLDSLYQVKSYKSYAHSNSYEISAALSLDTDGGYLIGAKRTNEGQVNSGFTSRTLIVKTDSLGVEQWQWLSPANKLWDKAQAMIRTPDGGLVVASGTGAEKWNNPANPHYLEWNALIFKLDTARNLLWQRPFRGYTDSGQTTLTEMVAAPDGSGFVACGIAMDTVGGQGAYHNAWLVKASNHGDSLWARHYAWFDGDFVAPEAWDMKATPDSGYVVVGYSLNVGQHVPGWIMKVDKHGCLIPGCNANDGPNATEEEKPEMKLAIYPNPTSDFLNFELRSPRLPQRASFRIVDSNGKVVKEMQSDSPRDTFILPVREWAEGAYILQTFVGNLLLTTDKFIVSH